jgi:two-component system CheB/CheR fusion protein
METRSGDRGGIGEVVTRAVLAFTPRGGGPRARFQRWALPPAATLVVTLVQLAVFPEPSIAPFVFFSVGVAVTAGLVGRDPALLCVALSAAVGNHLFMAPRWRWSVAPDALAATGLFLIGGTLVALVCAAFRTALLRLEVTARELDRRGELLRLSHDAIQVRGLDGTIEFWNRGAEQLYGFRADEALGRVSHELLRTSFPRPWGELRSELRERREWKGELVQRTKDGRTVIVSSNHQLLRGEDGRERVLEADRDVTEQRRSEQRLRAVYDLGLVGVLYWTADGTVTGANDRFLEMTGLSRAELDAGLVNWRSLTPPEWRALDDQAVRDLETTGVSAPYEKEYVRKDGSRLPVIVGGAMLDEARREGVAFVLDIGDRKKAEQALRESERRLREEARRKNEFLGVLSHELRNPLAPIRNSLYILSRAAPGGEQARRALAVIDRQVRHATRLVDDLLDVTRITRGKVRLQRERVDLGELARRAVEDHRDLFAACGVRLEVRAAAEPVIVNADPTRLAQVMGNLLQNAAKFTPRGGETTLAVARSDATAEVTVRDTGVGLAPQVLDRLFEPFVQADSTLDRSTGGLGLGLALVKGLAELHGGSVAASSDGVGNGAAFTVRLPLERRRVPRLTLVDPGRVRAVARRILVIEDNVDAAATLEEALELDGHEVEVAHSGPEGLARARAFRPDAIVCDIGLPGMDGFQIARAIRADPLVGGVGLVALSGYAQAEDLERSREAGFDLHLAKPPDLDALERAVAEAAEARARPAEPAAPAPAPPASGPAPGG